MRWIDADRLKVMFEIEECPCALQAAILGIIDEQPTAYYPDKVVEQLKEYLFEKYCVEGDAEIDKIVKAGGINDNSN